jgi:hypothetical protein
VPDWFSVVPNFASTGSHTFDARKGSGAGWHQDWFHASLRQLKQGPELVMAGLKGGEALHVQSPDFVENLTSET